MPGAKLEAEYYGQGKVGQCGNHLPSASLSSFYF